MNPNFQTAIEVVPAMGLLKGDSVPFHNEGMHRIAIGPSRRIMANGRTMVDVTIEYGETFISTVFRPDETFTVTRVAR